MALRAISLSLRAIILFRSSIQLGRSFSFGRRFNWAGHSFYTYLNIYIPIITYSLVKTLFLSFDSRYRFQTQKILFHPVMMSYILKIGGRWRSLFGCFFNREYISIDYRIYSYLVLISFWNLWFKNFENCWRCSLKMLRVIEDRTWNTTKRSDFSRDRLLGAIKLFDTILMG